MTNTNTINLSESTSLEETNVILKDNGYASYDDSLIYTFRIKKKNFFTVKFGDLKVHTQRPYFSTSGGVLNYGRSDYDRCGQCQDAVLSKGSITKAFYDKWDSLHLKALTEKQYKELLEDLEKLKEKYSFIESDRFNDVVKFDREMSK